MRSASMWGGLRPAGASEGEVEVEVKVDEFELEFDEGDCEGGDRDLARRRAARRSIFVGKRGDRPTQASRARPDREALLSRETGTKGDREKNR